MNPYKDLDDQTYLAPSQLSYVDIATKLLQDHYLLTALELHTELVENGKELPQLREFFSNPGNFENVSRNVDTNAMHRTPSQATLDSLDLARYSEDGGNERGGSGGEVAVLEFELRKARETINALRANLTTFADCESSSDKNVKEKLDQRSLKPHEKRALNFLVNEYLLLQNYKLTSITFSDENPDQDFEDWDDVGLNVPRHTGLISLYRGDTSPAIVPTCDAATDAYNITLVDVDCQTDYFEDDTNVCVSCQTSFDADTEWNHEILISAEEIVLLKQQIIALETEKLNFQRLYDAAIISLNSLTSPTSESKGLELNPSEDRTAKLDVPAEVKNTSTQPLTFSATENHYGSNASTNSVTPDQFELIDCEKNGSTRKESSVTSSFEPALLGEGSPRESPMRRGSVNTLDETLSINDGGDWTRVQYDYTTDASTKDMWVDCCLPNSLKAALLSWCCETTNSQPVASDLLAELLNNDKPITLQGLLLLVADTMTRIIPHTLVSRRCEAAALLAATSYLLVAAGPSGAVRRSRVLQLLLTLLKKPDVVEAKTISEAACLIVKWGGSGEVLSCIAELLASRSTERRILASQICLAVAPYVSVELCTSLLLSLVILMCESSEVEIRSLGLKAAALICPVAEHKYGQLETIMFGFLRDPIEKNVRDCVKILAPLLARSALIAGTFSTEYCGKVIVNLTNATSDKDWKIVILYLDIMKSLIPPTLMFIANVQIVRDYSAKNSDVLGEDYQDVSLDSEQENFLDVQCFVIEGGVEYKMLLVSMSNLVKEEPEVRWPELNWFLNNVIKQVLETVVNCKCINQPHVYTGFISVVSGYVDSLGPSFTANLVKPLFMDVISDLEQKMEKLHPVNGDGTAVVGIYLAAVLPVLEDKNNHVVTFLQRWIVYSGACGLPDKLFATPLKWLARRKPDLLNQCLQCLREIAASSCESNSGIAVRVYIANLISELGAVDEISEASVDGQLLPAVIALMHDEDVSVRESALGAWGSVMRAAVTRGLSCEARCWAALETALARDGTPLTAREAARATEALALLIPPSMDKVNSMVSDKAVSVLCALCRSVPATGEALSALVPGLQLAAHHAHSHPALAPTLRKLEENLQSSDLIQYKQAVEVLASNVASLSASPPELSAPPVPQASRLATSHILAAPEAVGRRVTQMFHQSKTNMNLPNIFRKKS